MIFTEKAFEHKLTGDIYKCEIVNINLSIHKVIFPKITSGCRRYLEAKFINVNWRFKL